jgi:hypothetical protein
LPVFVGRWFIPRKALDSYRYSCVATHPKTLQLCKIEGVVPSRFAVVVLEVSVQDWAYFFRGRACEDRTVPGAVAVYTAIDQPDIDFPLIGVYTERVTTGELA